MAQFKVGETYSCRSLCDHETVFSFEVTRRSAQFVWLQPKHGKLVRRKLFQSGDAEACNPFGTYSMAPVLTARSD